MAHFRKYRTSKGDIRYRAEIRLKGAKSFSKSFMRLSDAKIWAKDQDGAVHRQAAGIDAAKQYTVAEAVDRYIDEYLPKLRSKTIKSRLLWWKVQIGPRYLDTLRPSELLSLRNKLSTEPKLCTHPVYGSCIPLHDALGKPKLRRPKTIQGYMDALSLIFNKAVDEWEWVSHNPVARIKKIKVQNERTRFLSDHLHLWPGETKPRHWDDLTTEEKAEATTKFTRAYELPRLVDALKSQRHIPKIQNNHAEWAYYLFVIQLGTGLRLAEATHLVWEENDLINHPIVIVDMRRAVLLLKSTKHDASPRLKPLCKEAMDVLHMLYKEKRHDTPLVFPHEDGDKPFSFDKRIRKAIKDAKLQDFRWHDIRHTTASYLSMMGAGQREIMDALHHKTFSASQRYQHLSSDHLRGLLNKLTNTVLEEKEAPSRFEHTS